MEVASLLSMRPSTQLKRPKLKGVDIDTLKRLVAENAKQRYALTEEPDPANPEKHILWIRANQGHSLAVEDLEMHRIESPDECPIVVHGTFKRFWPIIQKEGLKVMNRHHVHCAAGLYGQGGVTSGELRALQIEDAANVDSTCYQACAQAVMSSSISTYRKLWLASHCLPHSLSR